MISSRHNCTDAIVMACRMVLLVLMGLALSGCVIIPTPSHGGVSVITKETIESFEPSKTTRADILLKLGDPSERLQEDQFFVYQWWQIHGYFLMCCYGPQLPLGQDHYLGLEFTPDNRLKRMKLIDPWLFSTPRRGLDEWMAEKPGSPNP